MILFCAVGLTFKMKRITLQIKTKNGEHFEPLTFKPSRSKKEDYVNHLGEILGLSVFIHGENKLHHLETLTSANGNKFWRLDVNPFGGVLTEIKKGSDLNLGYKIQCRMGLEDLDQKTREAIQKATETKPTKRRGK